MDEDYKRYKHVEYLDSDETEGLFNGTVYIEPKIDGTNIGVMCDPGGKVHYLGRNEELDTEKNPERKKIVDCLDNDWHLQMFIFRNPSWVIYGEFLIPMHIRYYEKTAYYKFYIFDVFDTVQKRYLAPEVWMNEAIASGCNVVPIIAKLENYMESKEDHIPESWENYVYLNRFLLPDDPELLPEGIVFKNYNHTNKYGRNQVFAKIVTSHFKKKCKRVKVPENLKEEDRMMSLALKYYPEEISFKVKEKINMEDRSAIPQLFERCWHDFIEDKLWTILKKEKNPVIDFGLLRNAVIICIKSHLPEFFR